MTIVKSLAIVALLVGGASLAMAQNGPPTPQRPQDHPDPASIRRRAMGSLRLRELVLIERRNTCTCRQDTTAAENWPADAQAAAVGFLLRSQSGAFF
jgi:hypothetical protein